MKEYDVVVEHLVSFTRCIRVTAASEEEAADKAVAEFDEAGAESELEDVIVHDVEEA